MNETAAAKPQRGQTVVTSDGIPLGPIEADERTHLRVRLLDGEGPLDAIFVPVRLVRGVENDVVQLTAARADLHEAVYTLSPGQQREYATLGLRTPFGRRRGQQTGRV